MKINKNIDFEIRQMPQPQMVIVPLKVSNGDPALPIVKMNEVVTEGQTIAKTAGFNSVNVFSPVYGRIVGFDSYSLSDHSKSYCVYIDNLDKSKVIKNDDEQPDARANCDNETVNGECTATTDESIRNSETSAMNAPNGSETLACSTTKGNNGNCIENAKTGCRAETTPKCEQSANTSKFSKKVEKQEQSATASEIPAPFSFGALESTTKALILKRLADCGVIDHNGDSVSDKLAGEHKMLVVPCFDVLPYACENTAVLASDYFDNIYNVARKLTKVWDIPAVFVCLKGDQMTGIEDVFDVNCELSSKLYSLFVKKTDPNNIFDKYFVSFVPHSTLNAQQTDTATQSGGCANSAAGCTQSASKPECETLGAAAQCFESENSQFDNKKDLLDSMLNQKFGEKIAKTAKKTTENVILESICEKQGDSSRQDKFAKMLRRALELSEYKNLENLLVLTPVDLVHIYRALELGVPQTTTIATFGGRALLTNGVYEICSGCTLQDIQTALGGTHSEQDIEDDKSDTYDAIEDFYDARSKYKEEKDETKKAQLKALMKIKKQIAKKMALQFVKNSKKRLKTCLGQIAFDDVENGETFGDFRAVFELRNKRLYYLTVSEC